MVHLVATADVQEILAVEVLVEQMVVAYMVDHTEEVVALELAVLVVQFVLYGPELQGNIHQLMFAHKY